MKVARATLVAAYERHALRLSFPVSVPRLLSELEARKVRPAVLRLERNQPTVRGFHGVAVTT